PLPPPTALPPAESIQTQARRDREHLRLLSIFHFVFGGFALVGVAFLCAHYAMMHAVFSNPAMFKPERDNMPPKAFLDAFIWFYLFMGALFLLGLIPNVLSGIFLWQRKNRLFSLIIAGIDCLQIPLGTALGVCTILVLSRESVRSLYSGHTEN